MTSCSRFNLSVSFLQVRVGPFISLLILVLLPLVCDGGELSFPRETSYPEVWSRMVDWPNVVRGMFQSDKEIWGNEPVLIIGRRDSENAIAEGFFTGARRRVFVKTKGNASEYYYEDGTPMAVVVPAKDILYGIEFAEGTQLEFLMGRNLVLASLTGPRDKKLTEEGLPYAVIARNCEPIDKTLALIDSHETILWEKAFVRYYGENEEAPPQEFETEQECGGLKSWWLSDGAGRSVLMLQDGTALMTGDMIRYHQKAQSTFVVRFRLKDGSSGVLPPKLMIIDNQDVIKAKLDLLRRYKQEMVLRNWNNDDLLASKEFSIERVYRDLARYFFNRLPTKD